MNTINSWGAGSDVLEECPEGLESEFERLFLGFGNLSLQSNGECSSSMPSESISRVASPSASETTSGVTTSEAESGIPSILSFGIDLENKVED